MDVDKPTVVKEYRASGFLTVLTIVFLLIFTVFPVSMLVVAFRERSWVMAIFGIGFFMFAITSLVHFLYLIKAVTIYSDKTICFRSFIQSISMCAKDIVRADLWFGHIKGVMHLKLTTASKSLQLALPVVLIIQPGHRGFRSDERLLLADFKAMNPDIQIVDRTSLELQVRW